MRGLARRRRRPGEELSTRRQTEETRERSGTRIMKTKHRDSREKLSDGTERHQRDPISPTRTGSDLDQLVGA